MPETRQRRSSRRALELPIRVFGTDFQGRDFVEDSTTLLVSSHGAKIRLTRKLIPEQEIRILSQGNDREALFRVVSKAGEPTGEFSFWGVECLESGGSLWEYGLARPGLKPVPRPAPRPVSTPSPKPVPKPGPELEPRLSSKEKPPAQAMLRCPQCGMRELINLDETQIQAMRTLNGLIRGCPACGGTGLWKRVAVQGS